MVLGNCRLRLCVWNISIQIRTQEEYSLQQVLQNSRAGTFAVHCIEAPLDGVHEGVRRFKMADWIAQCPPSARFIEERGQVTFMIVQQDQKK